MPPKNIYVHSLVNPSPEQIDEASRVVMVAFVSDPFVNAALRGGVSDEALYYRFSRAYVVTAAVAGGLWVAQRGAAETEKTENKENTETGGGMAGVACWFPPGSSFLDTEKQRQAAEWGTFLAGLPNGADKWVLEYFAPRLEKQCDDALGQGVKHDNWYLQTLAVAPQYQGEGIGRALIDSVVSKAFAEQKRVVWEVGNQKNLEIYESWGGKALNSELYETDYAPVGFRMWVMEMTAPRR